VRGCGRIKRPAISLRPPSEGQDVFRQTSRGTRGEIAKSCAAIVAGIVGLAAFAQAASGETASTREDALKDIAQKLLNCRALRVGRVHVKDAV
jgi:hypothetical protein